MSTMDEVREEISRIIERGECESDECEGCDYFVQTKDDTYCSEPELDTRIFDMLKKKYIILKRT